MSRQPRIPAGSLPASGSACELSLFYHDMAETSAPASVTLPIPEGRQRWVSWRSGLLATAGTVLVCGLTPYNDYVVANTYFVGSYLPIVIVLTSFILIVLVNAPLHRFAPRQALASGELAVILGAMLVSCSLPSSGLMRVLIPTIVAPLYYGGFDEQFWSAFRKLELPAWMFPVEPSEAGRASYVVTGFYMRLQEGTSVPFDAWVTPLIGWGIFVFAMFAAVIGLTIILRPQWANNERLPFPIVQLQLALIEAPRPGRMLNDMLGSRSFWIALVGVLLVQSMGALHMYFPRMVPQFPLSYDLHGIMADEPWVHFGEFVKRNRIYFTFIGITYFIQSRVSFSLWALFLLRELIDVQQRMMHREISGGAWLDQHIGASIVFVIGFLWIARHWWGRVLRHTFSRHPRRGEPPGDYLPHRWSVIVVLAGVVVMLLWLILLGVQVWVAAAAVAFILMSQFIVARVVAETGIPFFRAYTALWRVYGNLPPELFTGRDVYFAQQATVLGPIVTREALAPFAFHALQVHEGTQPPPRQRWAFLTLIVWALLLGFIVSAASSLWCYYRYASPIADQVQTMVNPWGAELVPQGQVVMVMKQWESGRFPPKPYNPWLHMGIGGGVMAFLQFAALRWAGWPFMPVGFLVSMTWFGAVIWFSVLIGWLCKVLIVNYGGAGLFQAGKPFFVGIIFGEALAAGVWLMVTIYLAQAGYEYHVIRFLPE
jgi:hypothetical protein